MAAAGVTQEKQLETGIEMRERLAAYLALLNAAIWAVLLLRWITFGSFDWQPLAGELALAELPSITAYLVYGGLLVVDALTGIGLLRSTKWSLPLGIARNTAVIVAAAVFYYFFRDFYGAVIIMALAGMMLVLESSARSHGASGWALAYPAAFWLLVFFFIPILIVFIVSLGERSRLGTVTYPPFDITNLGVYFDDYVRFFSPVSGEYIYLRIFWRSVWLATLNTVICLLFGYPFAYWIARQPKQYRGIYIFLVMIPFWTNFLVRTYAWMLILRDSGIINNVWTGSIHDIAVQLANSSAFFEGLAQATAVKLPLLFNTPAVLMGLFYGYLPFMVLPLYSNLEQLDWSLLEAAADLGAGMWQRTTRVLLPLTMPGIVAGSVIVFIPSLGAYVTPDLLGGGKVALLGNLLQQQFMTVRDWPFGSAIGFIMMAIMLGAIVIYFRTLGDDGKRAL
jgi:spermidine/putrescine transport system permease protein